MTLAQLREARATELRAAQALVEQARTAGLTDELRSQIDAHMTKAAELKTQIESAQADYDYLRAFEDEFAALTAPGERRTDPMHPGAGGAESRVIVPGYGNCRAFEMAYHGMPMHQIREKAYRAGKWMRAVLLGDSEAARWCKDQGVELRVMTGSVNGAGGYLVPDEVASTVLAVQSKFGVFRRNLTVWPMGSDSLSVPKLTAGLTVYYPNEGVTLTKSDLAFGQVPLSAKLYATLTQLSRALSDNAVIQIANLVTTQVGLAFAAAEDNNGFIGDGTAAYAGVTGVIPALDGVAGGAAGLYTCPTGHNTVAEIDAADIRGVMAKLPDLQGLMPPKWYCSKSVDDTVFAALKMAAGGATLSGSQGNTFLGYDVETTEALPKAAAAAGSTVILFGYLDAAVAMGERNNTEIAQSEQRYFEENCIGVRGTQTVAMNVHGMGTSAAAGPIVGLKLAES